MRDPVSKVNEEIRIRWTGTARYDHEEALRWLFVARGFVSADPDRAPGWRRGEVYAGPKMQVFIYWTKARVVVVRIHGVSDA